MSSAYANNDAAAGPEGSTSHRLAPQDYICLGYQAYMLQCAVLAPDSADATTARWFTFALFATTAIGLILSRGRGLLPDAWREPVYRAAVLLPVVASYAELKVLLSSMQPHVVDHQLWAIDRALFGETPSITLAPLMTAAVTEWFAFFYYSYFPILMVVVAPALFRDEGRNMFELRMGAMLVFAIGHIGYTLVPAYGPYEAITFAHPLEGGFWWGKVLSAVHVGALMDVFPSLHTAVPTFLVLHGFAYRNTPLRRVSWLVLLFFAANIVVSTMLLRWHYAIDVLAGLALATFARTVATKLPQDELAGKRSS